MEIVRDELNPNDLYADNLRYNPETDTVEITNDGGETWQPAPNELDPRHQTQFTARPTDNTACDAAYSMVVHMQKILDAVIRGFAGGALVIAATIITLLFPPAWALLLSLIALIAEGLLSIGLDDLNSFAAGGTWHTLQCILLCNLDENGVLSDAGYANVHVDVDAQVFGVDNAICHYLFNMAGAGGLNYAASEGIENADGDCSACAGCDWCVDLTPDNYTDWYFTNWRERGLVAAWNSVGFNPERASVGYSP